MIMGYWNHLALIWNIVLEMGVTSNSVGARMSEEGGPDVSSECPEERGFEGRNRTGGSNPCEVSTHKL